MRPRHALIILCLSFAALTAHAKEGGNGGYASVCRDNTGAIISAEMLDVFEGRELYKLDYAERAEVVGRALDRLNPYIDFAKKIRTEYIHGLTHRVFVRPGQEFIETKDALPVIRQKGCDFEQAAVFTDEGELFISQEIFDHLDEFNRTALYLHEALYLQYRRFNKKIPLDQLNSRASRKLTAYLLAETFDENVMIDLVGQHDSGNLPESCGTAGSQEERLHDCRFQPNARLKGASLIMRLSAEQSVYLDHETYRLWASVHGPRSPVNFLEASNACRTLGDEFTELASVGWRLPSPMDYLELERGQTAVIDPSLAAPFYSDTGDVYLNEQAQKGGLISLVCLSKAGFNFGRP